ncbi:unnamed protein product [Ectocarpus sp. 6 AP-2014]
MACTPLPWNPSASTRTTGSACSRCASWWTLRQNSPIRQASRTPPSSIMIATLRDIMTSREIPQMIRTVRWEKHVYRLPQGFFERSCSVRLVCERLKGSGAEIFGAGIYVVGI